MAYMPQEAINDLRSLAAAADKRRSLNSVKTALALVAIAVISGLNAALVFVASLLGIYGDGTAGPMPLVLGIGLTWVGAFGIAALYLAWRGERGAGIWLSAKALPYAGLLIGMGVTVWLLKGFFQ